tara:strand:+ start:547 stop:678 length:132 start_codon:yes stop_codon:yes gene_type:complete
MTREELVVLLREKAEAPDVYDVTHKEPMLYLSEVIYLIESLDN